MSFRLPLNTTLHAIYYYQILQKATVVQTESDTYKSISGKLIPLIPTIAFELKDRRFLNSEILQ